MKLTIAQKELNEAIQQVAKAASARPAIPILGGIKFDVTHQGVTLTASDTEISIQCFVPAQENDRVIARIEKPGSVVLPAKILVELVKKLSAEEVEMEVGTTHYQTHLRAGSSDIQMNGIDPEEFPILPDVEDKDKIVLTGEQLKTLVRQTAFAASTNEQTPVLTGVLWQLEQARFKFVATDRHRLASSALTVETAADYRFSNIVIASRTLIELSRLIQDNEQAVDIIVTPSQVLFKLGNVLLYARLLDGTYPDTSKIIPHVHKTELVLDTKKLTEAMDRANLMSREEKTNIVRLQTNEDDTISISSSSSDFGQVNERLDVIRLTGDPLRITFNCKFMLDALKVLESPQLFIGFNGTMSPIIIKPMDENATTVHLILPYRTAG